jgi:5-methylcytosine-specific restriction endonuclease McrA
MAPLALRIILRPAHARAIWKAPRPKPLHVQQFMRLRYCPSCKRAINIRAGKKKGWSVNTKRKLLHGNLYNGPLHTECNRCRVNKRSKEQYRTNPHQKALVLAYTHRTRSRDRGHEGPDILVSDIATVLARGECWYCGATDQLTIDHIVPVSKGGTHELSNLRCGCADCNNAKRVMSVAQFRDWAERLAAHFPGADQDLA